MYKKLIPIILFCLLLPTVASAYSVVSENDPQNIISPPYYHYDNDEIRIDYAPGVVTKTIHNFYHDAAFTSAGTSRTNTAPSGSSFTASGFTCVGWYELQVFDSSDTQVASLKVEVAEGDLRAPKCDSESNPEDVTKGCIGCALFECPGWLDYMGKLDQIKAAIPPAPNWPVVADIFRDSIAPRIKADMADLIGVSPTPIIPSSPATPNVPSAPQQPSELDNRGITAPIGNEAPGLEDSTFSPDDIKQAAPIIQERQDPTGGFKITDPIAGLPSQEEFEGNAPIEGEAPFPSDPLELENPSPTPIEQENPSPTPTEDIGTAPTPGEVGGEAPIPGDDSGTPPIPGDDSGTAPIPGDTGGTAPTPGEPGDFTAPYP